MTRYPPLSIRPDLHWKIVTFGLDPWFCLENTTYSVWPIPLVSLWPPCGLLCASVGVLLGSSAASASLQYLLKNKYLLDMTRYPPLSIRPDLHWKIVTFGLDPWFCLENTTYSVWPIPLVSLWPPCGLLCASVGVLLGSTAASASLQYLLKNKYLLDVTRYRHLIDSP